MKILITGGTGFLGEKISESISNEKKNKIFVLTNRKKNINRPVKQNEILIEYNQLYKCFQDGIDLVLHAATNYDNNIDDLQNVFMSNLQLPMELIDLCKKNNVKYFINIDSFYSSNKNIYTKKLPFYKLSKKQLLEWIKLYASFKKINFINIKIFHLFGHEENNRKFINYLINNMIKNKQIELSSGNEKINFVYIKDVIEAIKILIKNIKFISKEGFIEFHLGYDEKTSIKKLVAILAKIINSESQIRFNIAEENDDKFDKFDKDKSLFNFINYAQRYDLKTGLEDIVNYKMNKLNE